jgi:hypothetical protein
MRLAASLLACAVIMLGVVDASAAKKNEDKAKDAASSKPALVGSYGDWKVYHTASGRSKICYLLAEPKSREPDDSGAKAYAFISERPAEHVRNEISFVMGFEVATAVDSNAKDAKDKKKSRKPKKGDSESSAAPKLTIGDDEFDLAPKGSDLWVKNTADEGKVIDVMRKGSNLVITAATKKGRKTVDTYSLAGFSQAIDKALKDCPAG